MAVAEAESGELTDELKAAFAALPATSVSELEVGFAICQFQTAYMRLATFHAAGTC